MPYRVKEIYYTLQGEGHHCGRPAIFLRFTGCNLWSGREADRAKAICQFCDTDFIGIDGPGGGEFPSVEALVEAVVNCWPSTLPAGEKRLVVCTGGEPLLQLDAKLVAALQQADCEVAVETNGTVAPPAPLDWVCVSPKAGAKLVLREGDELKLVYPQQGIDPADYQAMDFRYFYLQPMDGPGVEEAIRLATRYCLEHPPWRLSLQMHKRLGLR